MRTITLFLFAALVVTSVDAASYQKINGTIVDPIQSVWGGALPYSGNNVEPYADLYYADLSGADLYRANLNYADLSDANLYYAILTDATLTGATLDFANLGFADLTGADLSLADLTGANLNSADLSSVDLTGAWIWGADLSDADLSGSILTDIQYNVDATWTDAFYDYRNEPTWDSGMDAAWRSSAGILRTTPEPAAILLALWGLALLPRRRRR